MSNDAPIMMEFSDDDILAAKLVEPGWYNCEVVDVVQKLSKDKSSMNTWIHLKGLDGESAGVPFRHCISEKATMIRTNQNFVRACGVELTKGAQVNLRASKGLKVRVSIIRDNYNNNPSNKVADFAPAE